MLYPSEIIGLLTCFALSAYFSGSEAVLLSIGIDRAHQLIKQGGAKGRAMALMTEKPSELLTTILVGNNVANILAAGLTTTIASRFFANDALSISTGITTFLILVFGEIVPKTFGRSHAEKLSLFVIRSLQLVYYLLWPVINSTVYVIRKVLGPNAELRGRLVTKNDIEYLINKAENEKTIDPKQIELLSSIMEFPTIKVKDIMVPRTKIKYISGQWSYEKIVAEVKRDVHSRYPVCDGELEKTKGFLHVKDLVMVPEASRANFNAANYLKAPFFVYEHMKIQAVFDHMNRKKVHMALVKDENGVVVGIITLEDIVEQIVGEIIDEHDDEVMLPENSMQARLEQGIVVSGTIPLRDLYNEYDIKIPLNDTYSTLAGFLLDMLGNNFPEEEQIIVWEGHSFELLSVQDQQIKEVLIKNIHGDKFLYSRKDAQDEENSKENSNENNSSKN